MATRELIRRGGRRAFSRRTVVAALVATGGVAVARRQCMAESSASQRSTDDQSARRLMLMHDALPSWNDGPSKQAILDFVAAVTNPADSRFVSPADRIATFDNDGTLWCEQPMYAQGFFAIDRIRAMAPEHPEWRTEQPFATILADGLAAMSGFTEHDIAAVIAATHAGMTTDAFDAAVETWLTAAQHPRFGQLFTACVYQPQLELLGVLRANEFRTFIVSGGGIDFLRSFADAAYGIPPNQVIGSSTQLKFEMQNGGPVLVKLPQIGSVDDGAGKPVNIRLHIGQKPIFAFGNSDGDKEMLEYTDSGDLPRLMLLVHHDDPEREYAYDRDATVGALDAAWDEAVEKRWVVVSMKRDWRRVFSFGK